MRFVAAATSILALSLPAFADAPRVVTDILPVQGLVSRVMDGVGTPDLILPPNASPHGYALRPSEARSIAAADIVVWIGPALTPWLEEPMETLAPGAVHLTLMGVDDITVMPFRDGATFEAHDHSEHGDSEEHADEHNHDEHAEEKEHDHAAHDHEEHASEHKHDHEEAHGHDKEHAEEEGHDHAEEASHDDHDHAGGKDPHVWLDPRNGAVFLSAIAEELARIDPDNAAVYRSNAEAGRAELTALEAEIRATLAPISDPSFIVFHDAFHYFEARFEVEASGAISASDATMPGAARVAELREHISESGANCAFAEPQFNPKLLATVTEGEDVRSGVLDPLGVNEEMGVSHYPATLRALGQAMAACLTPSG